VTELNVRHQAIRFVRLPEVKEISGLSRSTVYARVKEGRFPPPVRIGARAVGWIEHELLRWAEDRVTEARARPDQSQLIRAA
jgi:prophage regulatory protein